MGKERLRVTVTLDGGAFRRFAWYDTMVLRRGWRRPAGFAAAFVLLAVIAFTNTAAGAAGVFLGALLLLLGIGLPLSWLVSFTRSVRKKIKSMGLPRAVYKVELDDGGVTCYHTAGVGAAETTPWADVYGVWRRPDAFYLYVRPDRAYLLPDESERQTEKLRAAFTAHLPPQRLHAVG